MNERDKGKNQKPKKPTTNQEYPDGTSVRYASKMGGKEVERTVQILCYVPSGATLKEVVRKAKLSTAEETDLHKDVGLEGAGPKYLVREAATGRRRARYFYPSAGTVNAGTLAT